MGNEKEQRRHPRVPLESEATLTVVSRVDALPPMPLKGLVRDLGAFGVGFWTHNVSRDYYDRLLEDKREARLTFRLPTHARALTLAGKIQWADHDDACDPPVTTFGLQFDALDEEQSVALRECVESIQSQIGE